MPDVAEDLSLGEFNALESAGDGACSPYRLTPMLDPMTRTNPIFRAESLAPRPTGASTPADAIGVGAVAKLPADAIAILPVRNTLLFPATVVPLSLGRARSVAAAQYATRNQAPVGILLQRNPETEEPGPADLHEFGTVGVIARYVTSPDGNHHAICRGEERFRVVEFLPGYPFLVARIEWIAEPQSAGAEIDARMAQLKERASEALRLIPNAPQELTEAVQTMSSAGALADVVASVLDLKAEDKQRVLETVELRQRLDMVLWYLAYRLEVLRLSHDIGQRTRDSMESRQREHLLREQLRTIQKELGEADEQGAEVAQLTDAIAKAKMPEDMEKHARKELSRLARMPDGAAEYSMVRTYLEWLTELPWAIEEARPIDIAEARKILEDDHYGLAKIKRRILEYLAVRKLNPTGKAPILCFVGPPGVGKTSLGQSIARAMGRKFVRVSLGGLHDEAEIRGHRRTYIGALPGNIIQGIRKAGSRDCVMMLDEIDKLGRGFHGDPSSALLEVLDPAQNSTFRDNYLGMPFDLSRVVFIATANMLDTVPGPLLDRMEVIPLAGYTLEEKLQIARRYLVPRQLEANGLKPEQCEIADAALEAIIRDYTREAGVRNLEREIGAVLRHSAMRIAEDPGISVRITEAELATILGPRRFEAEQAQRASIPGVATGLAWTPVGGDILFIEATRIPGSGKLILTGQLGEVMKESAQAALSLVKSKHRELGFDPKLLEGSDIHVHVPAGATPKDGPSAGVAMFIALASQLLGRTVRNDLAMTGEISLRGLVLPVGGIKEKVLAAMHAGIKTVMLPARNRRDWDDIPEEARRTLEFVWLDSVEQALAAALPNPARETAPAAA
ncbi:MAG TPA: endopeptidase La [Stellaceae bacterium]|nr:endopeptidase La [Stellaceae bacterium]